MTYRRDDFILDLWRRAGRPNIVHTHARLWPNTQRALCTGQLAPDSTLSVGDHQDDDADVTCGACLKILRDQR